MIQMHKTMFLDKYPFLKQMCQVKLAEQKNTYILEYMYNSEFLNCNLKQVVYTSSRTY